MTLVYSVLFNQAISNTKSDVKLKPIIQIWQTFKPVCHSQRTGEHQFNLFQPKKNIVFSGAKPIIKCAEYPILFSLNKQESAKHKCEKMD